MYWTSPSIPYLLSKESPIKATVEQVSYLTVLPTVTMALFSIPASKLINILGRKKCLLLLAIPYIISWVLIAIGTSIWIFYAARLFSGVSEAMIFSALPAYTGEILTPKLRGSWGNGMSIFLSLGIFVINLVGGDFDTRTTAFILGPIPIIFLISFAFMPETPYYYIMKGKDEKAKQSLRWLRQKEDVDEEFAKINEGVKEQLAEPGTFKELFYSKSNRKALTTAVMLRVTQQLSGLAPLLMYSKLIFNEAGGSISANTSAVICAAVLVISSLMGAKILNFIGKRKAVLISSAGCNAMLILVGTYVYLKDTMDLSNFSWIPVVGMIVYFISISIGLVLIPTLVLSELFSAKIKGKALAVTNIVYAICIGSTAKVFQLLSSAYGLYTALYFYAVCCTVGTCISYFIMPETTGKTLAQIQRGLKGSKRKPSISVIEADTGHKS